MIIVRLLERLGQLFAALSATSAQRLHILVSCFRHFVTKIRGQPGHNSGHSESRSPAAQCDTVLTSTSSTQCLHATPLLPFHNTRATSSTPGPDTHVVTALPSTPHFNAPVASVPQQATSPRTPLVPFTASDVSRYDSRPLVCVPCYNKG
jgi:hypothetical protein